MDVLIDKVVVLYRTVLMTYVFLFFDHQLLNHGRWFSPVTPASSTTKINRHNIAEILLKTPKINQNHRHRFVLQKRLCLFAKLEKQINR
jgi:hypothetical protein